MKQNKLKRSLFTLLTAAAILVLPIFKASADVTASTNGSTSSISNMLDTLNLGDAVSKVYAEAQAGGLFSATNYAIEAYATYAPNIKADHKVGGGILAIYNFNQYAAAGLGVDYLGQFSLVSGNLTLRYPFNLGSKVDRFLPNSWTGFKSFADSVIICPFVLGGLGTPMSGSSASIATIADAGAYIQYGHLWGGKFNTGACWGRWTGAGDYDGVRYHFFLGWSKGF